MNQTYFSRFCWRSQSCSNHHITCNLHNWNFWKCCGYIRHRCFERISVNHKLVCAILINVFMH